MQKIKVKIKKSLKKEQPATSKDDKQLIAMAEAGGEYGKGRLRDVAKNMANERKEKMTKKSLFAAPTTKTKSGTYEPTSTTSRIKKKK